MRGATVLLTPPHPLTTTPCKEGIVADKQCTSCGETKPLEHYPNHPECRGGKSAQCKACHNARQRAYRTAERNSPTRRYEKTKQGFLMRAYRNMKSRVTGVQWRKAHLYAGRDILPRLDFYEWATSDLEFHRLFEEWENAGYTRRLTPSVDRLDSRYGYQLENMRWTTHSENSRGGCISRYGRGQQKNAYMSMGASV
jgi:hypothetical protein